jgi:hypothetical protein
MQTGIQYLCLLAISEIDLALKILINCLIISYKYLKIRAGFLSGELRGITILKCPKNKTFIA